MMRKVLEGLLKKFVLLTVLALILHLYDKLGLNITTFLFCLVQKKKKISKIMF